jgi:hypothetical protein
VFSCSTLEELPSNWRSQVEEGTGLVEVWVGWVLSEGSGRFSRSVRGEERSLGRASGELVLRRPTENSARKPPRRRPCFVSVLFASDVFAEVEARLLLVFSASRWNVGEASAGVWKQSLPCVGEGPAPLGVASGSHLAVGVVSSDAVHAMGDGPPLYTGSCGVSVMFERQDISLGEPLVVLALLRLCWARLNSPSRDACSTARNLQRVIAHDHGKVSSQLEAMHTAAAGREQDAPAEHQQGPVSVQSWVVTSLLTTWKASCRHRGSQPSVSRSWGSRTTRCRSRGWQLDGEERNQTSSGCGSRRR